jgi:hypothetical protein
MLRHFISANGLDGVGDAFGVADGFGLAAAEAVGAEAGILEAAVLGIGPGAAAE